MSSVLSQQLRKAASRLDFTHSVRPNLLNLRGFVIAVSHVTMILVSFIAAFWIRFEFSESVLKSPYLITGLKFVIPIKILAFVIVGLQLGWWRYAGLSDLLRIYVGNVAASLLATIALFFWFGPEFPRSIYVIDFLICFLLTAGSRFCVRLYVETLRPRLSPAGGKGVLIYGASAAGRTLLRETRTDSSLGFRVLGFVDDDPKLRSARIMDVPVHGTGRDIAYIVERFRNRNIKIDEVLIAMPSLTGRQMQEIYAYCRAAGVTCKTVPSIGELLKGKYLSSQVRNISIEDLLGREEIELEEQQIAHSIAGTSVLITGAAGSIGSELSRQSAAFGPKKLVILDHAESDLFKIEQELRTKFPDLDIVPVICDIKDLPSLDEVVRIHAIKSIYHAAAYKHVPMMEAQILVAARNNVIGTWNLIQAAQKHRVSNFLMISSDKAVNPSSVMGVTKRIAEIIVAAASQELNNGTVFNSVRFGNVVGSNGSVVPIFQSQIASNGPVTVTHREMRRYFMSIHEAVQLVLQASTMGKGSEIFVLDMGEPVRILDLAHNMIHLAGLTPDVDIEVRFTGLRPGEKLFEEISLDGEDMLETHHSKIRIFKGRPPEASVVSVWIDQLMHFIERRDAAAIRSHFAILVPEYRVERRSKPRKPVSETTVGLRQVVSNPHGIASRKKLPIQGSFQELS
jgi:FlaA1/EpsC-like NDP-sugar epimerase